MPTAKPPVKTSTRSNAHGLTLAQQSAVDLLAAGQTDTAVAEALQIHRVTVTRWRLYSPEFRAALADQRAAIWGASADRLRALLPKALDALAEALDRAEDKVAVALAVLKLAGPLPMVSHEPIDADEIVRRTTEAERQRAMKNQDGVLERYAGLQPYNDHLKKVRRRLALLAPPDGEQDAPAGG